MSLASTLESTLAESSEFTSLDKLQGLLDPQLLKQAFEHAGVATVRRRRLPLDAVMWSVVGMSLFRHESVWDIASKLDISLPGKHKLVAPSALVQARQRLGYEAVQKTFELLASRAFGSHAFEQWNGLNLLAVDGVVYRTEDTAENLTSFGCERNNHSTSPYPQVRMCCLMEVSSHLLLGSAFDGRDVGEMSLAQELIEHVPSHSLTLFDRGYYSVGLLHQWQQAGEHTHWMIPARKDLQFSVTRQLNENDALITLTPSPRAKKRFPSLPDTLEARLTTYYVKGKSYRVLSSLTDPLRFPYDSLTEVYAERWEIELGFREMKQSLLHANYTLRSKKPDMVRQELWGLLLAYNLVRIAMLDATNELDINPTRLSFSHCARHVMVFLTTIPIRSANKLPLHYQELLDTLRLFVLPDKRPDRRYPRVVRKKPTKYPYKRKCQSVLN